jgi:hypothetical protein
LGRKLGYRTGMRVLVDGMPDTIRHEIEQNIDGTPEWLRLAEPDLDAAHLFATSRAALEERLTALLPLVKRDGFIWVSWPKKAAKAPTDITEDVIRELALPLQLVDVKVCAVDQFWSGLKLVIRKEHR